MDLILNVLKGLWESSGFATLEWQNLVMILVSFVFLFLAIHPKFRFEPLLLVPIAFGILLANLPGAGIMDDLTAGQIFGGDGSLAGQGEHWYDSGVLRIIYAGVKSNIFPCLIFMGVGAMTDFGPLLSNPVSLLLGAAAQLGIYVAFLIAIALGFNPQEAASIAIIGGADGPTAIYLTSKLASHLLAPIALAAYSYMALIPLIQPPIMKALTTKKEREVKMTQLRKVTKTEKIIFPVIVLVLVALILPSVAPLLGMFFSESFFTLLQAARLIRSSVLRAFRPFPWLPVLLRTRAESITRPTSFSCTLWVRMLPALSVQPLRQDSCSSCSSKIGNASSGTDRRTE